MVMRIIGGAPDVFKKLISRKREIDTFKYSPPDKQERKEREDAAIRYSEEDEKHFVDYALDCVNQSVKSTHNIRRIQSMCWDVYEEKEPPSYFDKEIWQSKTIIPRPFQTVQFGASAIKKAFSPDFLSIEKAKDTKKADFWQRYMEYQLDELHAKFPLIFSDASRMGLAIGVSMEMIPIWIPGLGLRFSLIEPWKIHRDSDAVPRDPQSGMYWIHEEWLDYWVLKQKEKSGKYENVDLARDTQTTNTHDPMLSKEAVEKRKGMVIHRSEFRDMILTREFWGDILSPKGELLISGGVYTLATNRVIERPKYAENGYRWPGISFSPMPHLLRHGGRGLLEGVLTIWEAMCNILCLHEDYIKWVVNPPTEINLDGLDNPRDAGEIEPGAKILTRDTAHGQQVIRADQRRSRSNDILSNMQFYDQLFGKGSFVSDRVQGLPGWRKQEPYRLAAMDLDQAMGVFGLMGSNIEDGAIHAITLAARMIRDRAGYDDYLNVFREEELKEYGIFPDPEAPNGVAGVPELDGTFHVSGIQALMRDAETLTNLKEVIIPLAERPTFAPYTKPYRILRAIETRTNLTDEGVIATEDEAKIIDLQMQLTRAKEQEAMDRLQELQEALGVTELVQKIEEIEASSLPELAKRISGIEAPRGKKAEG